MRTSRAPGTAYVLYKPEDGIEEYVTRSDGQTLNCVPERRAAIEFATADEAYQFARDNGLWDFHVGYR